jgi:putative DNA primase/helicase
MAQKAESSEAAANKELTRQLRSFHNTDAGNAQAFALLHADKRFRYDHDKCKWLVWNGKFWERDKDNEADRAALETARARLLAATVGGETNEEDITWALGSESVSRRQAILKSAQSIRSLATTSADYDRDPFLLTVGNGTLNLTTGKLQPFRANDLITHATDVIYNEDASAPRWQQFLTEIFADDREVIQFVQKAVGYSLTGDTREQCLFILWGNGANGKSTFLETIIRLLGTHAATTPFSTVMVQRNPGGPRNDLAALHGARLVKASEAEQKNVFAESTVKEITGGDTITARFLFKEHFSYKPSWKLWLSSNFRPDIRGTDDAIWRRIRLIPFTRQFTGTNKDARLREKLEAELPGILSWAVSGCMLWQNTGLKPARTVENATLEYRLESDQVGRFIKDRCQLQDSARTPAKLLYDGFLRWCVANHEKPLATNQFAAKLAERGFERKRGRNGVGYIGVELVAVSTTDTPAVKRKHKTESIERN